MKSDEFKSLVETLSHIIGAKAKTIERIFKAEIRASEKRVTEELRAEILAARAEAKTDNLTLAAKVVKRVNSHERRMDAAGVPNPEKH